MYQQKQSIIVKFLTGPATLTIIGFVVLVLIAWPLLNNIKKQISINDEIGSLEREIEGLENKNSELKGLITYLNSDQFAEEQARLNLNYKKQGEEVVVIKEQADPTNAPANPSSIYKIEGYENRPAEKERSKPRKWLDYFLK